MKVLELKGFKSLRALNTFSTLVLGLKMLPAYMTVSYEDFLESLQAMPEDDQRKMLKTAVQFVNLEKDEIESLVTFCCDANGVPYSSENLKSMGPEKIAEMIIEVCMQIVKIKIDLVSESEKKK